MVKESTKHPLVSIKEIASLWQLSERSIRHYCAEGRVFGAVLHGKTWLVPKNATKPERRVRHSKKSAKKVSVLTQLKREKDNLIVGGLYHKIQIELTFNSNHIEGSRLSEDETRYIYETNTIGSDKKNIVVDDIVETVNHFRCIDLIIDNAAKPLSESFIKKLHLILKNGTSDSRKSWFMTGEYKKIPNEVGRKQTASPKDVSGKIKKLLSTYNSKTKISFDDLLDFHYQFEIIHPFQDGNGRVGRLILFKECLKNNITPFIIKDALKAFYYRGLNNWKTEHGFLRDTCLTCQDTFTEYLTYFNLV